jgi:hypothetical protein
LLLCVFAVRAANALGLKRMKVRFVSWMALRAVDLAFSSSSTLFVFFGKHPSRACAGFRHQQSGVFVCRAEAPCLAVIVSFILIVSVFNFSSPTFTRAFRLREKPVSEASSRSHQPEEQVK